MIQHADRLSGCPLRRLEAQSLVRADINASYLDEGPKLEVPARLFESPKALLKRIPEEAVRNHIFARGTSRLQRRWVERGMPNYGLLDALGIAYGHLIELVHDAHRKLGLGPPLTVDHRTGQTYDIAALG
ncbi:MAG: hypothetical protein JOZ17_12840 [Acetobacteraceae bacterium]|nr:hypothetical protein [Acetobacteraceae bacterium]